MIKEFIMEGLKCIALGILDTSYYICLFVAMLGVIFYVAGCKKAGKYVSISMVTYVLAECLRGFLV